MDREERRKVIATLNDQCRDVPALVNGAWVWTPGVRALGSDAHRTIAAAIRGFSDFKEGDNPYGERDFGAFSLGDVGLYWKIDYYNLTLDGGSEDPADVEKTKRVLTIMLAEEY